jgi:hypothetical protein
MQRARATGMEDENPYAPPRSALKTRDQRLLELLESGEAAWRDGKTLIVRKGAELPDRCVKCNAPAHGYRLRRSLSWHSSVWYLVVLINILLYVIVALIVRRTGKVAAGLCPRHRARRAWAIALGWLTALAGFGSCIAGALLWDVRQNSVASPSAPILLGVGLILFVGGMIGGIVGSRVLVPNRIDKNLIWLTKLSPQYLATFPDWNA